MDYMDDSDSGSEVKPPMDKEKEGETTALLPKSILAGKEFKPGEEVVLKIVHIYEDEVEVAYATGKEESHDESMPHEDKGEYAAMEE